MTLKRAPAPAADSDPSCKAAKTMLQVLDHNTFFQRSQAARQRTNPNGHFLSAMYSSLVDGIVTDPELMVLPLDDHAIVRGHAIFDTASLSKGRVYRLGIHLDRLFASARDARLKLPFGEGGEEENRQRMTDIICQTCVASGKKDGNIRYWLSAGPGNFGFTSSGCEPAFYCVVYGSVRGISVSCISEVTIRLSAVPMKPPLLARIKSNNYMLNCLTAMEAQSHGGKFGIMIRDDDTVAEGAVANCAVVTADGVFLTPPFHDILAGTTVRKAMDLAKKNLLGEGGLLREVRQEVLPLTTLRSASEVLMMAGDTSLLSVIKLDGQQVGEGVAGPVGKKLFQLILEDLENGEEDHIQLVY